MAQFLKALAGLAVQFLEFFSHYGASSPLLTARTLAAVPEQQSRQFRPRNESSSEEFVASDGRKIGVAYYGASSGPTVFYLHGFPGCRLSGVFYDAPAQKLGARIIAVERPGVGISSPQPGRNVLDHARDIRELAEHLNLESYGIIGVSGGGPYALACAYSLPEEKLKSVCIVGGMGPIAIGTKGMSWGNWLIFKGFLYCPTLVRWVQNRVVSILNSLPNEKIVEMAQRQLSKRSYKWFGPNTKDSTILRDTGFLTLMVDFYREHYRQGVDGHMEEGRVMTSELGFRLQDIRPSIPIQLWYGRQDTNVPLRMGEAIATSLGSRPDFYIRDETHLGLVLNSNFEALERLLEKM